MRWTGRRSRVASERAPEDGIGPSNPLVGHEEPNGQARLAERRGREAGAVRLPRREALGLDAPAEKEIRAIGRIRRARVKRDGIKAEDGPRGRIASAGRREDRARALHGELNARLGRLRSEVRPLRAEAVATVQRVLAELERTYRNLPLVERGVPGLKLWIVEPMALAVASFDAVFMDNPLQKAGILNAEARYVWLAAIAFVIAGAIHAAGVFGGMLSLRLSERDRRKMAMGTIVAVLGLLLIGFLLLGVLRHQWTAHSNQAVRDARPGQQPIPEYLDLLFLTPLQIAGALGAAALFAVYVMGQRGRELRESIETAGQLLDASQADLRATDRQIAEQVPNAIERAALEVHAVRVDKAKAEVDLETVRADTAAALEYEEGLTDAAINRYRVEYEITDRQYANGKSRFVRNPDGMWRHWRRWAVDDAPEERPTEPGHDAEAELDQLLLDLHNGR